MLKERNEPRGTKFLEIRFVIPIESLLAFAFLKMEGYLSRQHADKKKVLVNLSSTQRKTLCCTLMVHERPIKYLYIFDQSLLILDRNTKYTIWKKGTKCNFSVLGHPNLRAFIGHGGISGVYEAINCGVPMLLFPQYGDQMMNAATVEERGFGISMELNEATVETIEKNLRKILGER